MGITQHRFGVQNVQAIANLALARGMVGREHCGLMAIRGHSGVQGGAEVGAVPWNYPGGDPVGPEGAARLRELWGFEVPTEPGLTAVEMIKAAAAGDQDVLYSLGGNFLETLPEPDYVRAAVERIPLRVHQDIVLNPQMMVEPAATVVLLPAQTRYEQRGGGTEKPGHWGTPHGGKKVLSSGIRPLQFRVLRDWYIGRAQPSQGCERGSTPLSRSDARQPPVTTDWRRLHF